MTPRFPLMLVALSLAQLACGGDGTGPDNTPLCEEPTPLALGVGEHQIVDPLLETSCLSLPGGDAVREYLVVPYAGRGEQTGNGVTATFQAISSPTAGASGETVTFTSGMAAAGISRFSAGSSP